jgi:hypothetical protein
MVLSDRTKGCCSSDLNEPLHPNHDQFAELDAHNFFLPRSRPLRQLAGDPESSHPSSAPVNLERLEIAVAVASASDESDLIWWEIGGAQNS